MDEHTIRCNTETGRNREQVNNIKPIVPIKTPKGKMTRKSPAESPILLQREIPMAWGTTTDSFDSKNQYFPICNRNKMSNTKGSDLVPYFGWLK